MSWLKIDDGFHSHPKIWEVGNGAAGLFVRLLSYCSDQLTDGEIPAAAVKNYGKRAEIRALLDVGLITVDASNAKNYRVPDYLDFNPSREEVLADRAEKHQVKAAAGRLGGIASGVARRKHSGSTPEAEHEAQHPAERKQNEAPSRPVPIDTGCTDTSRRLTAVPEPGRRDDLESVLAIITDARVDGARNVRNRRSYRTAVLAEARLQDGELAASLLHDGSTIEQTAMYILGHGIGAEAEHDVQPETWCTDACEACHGDHWVYEGGDYPTYCPNGPRAQRQAAP